MQSRSVMVAWKRPFDGNSPIIGYLVQYRPLTPGRDWDQIGTLNLTLPASAEIRYEFWNVWAGPNGTLTATHVRLGLAKDKVKNKLSL